MLSLQPKECLDIQQALLDPRAMPSILSGLRDMGPPPSDTLPDDYEYEDDAVKRKISPLLSATKLSPFCVVSWIRELNYPILVPTAKGRRNNQLEEVFEPEASDTPTLFLPKAGMFEYFLKELIDKVLSEPSFLKANSFSSVLQVQGGAVTARWNWIQHHQF